MNSEQTSATLRMDRDMEQQQSRTMMTKVKLKKSTVFH